MILIGVLLLCTAVVFWLTMTAVIFAIIDLTDNPRH